MLHPRHGEAVELKRGTVLFIVLWLLVQLATPAILLVKSGGGVSPFGWQMFADIPTLPEYWVERTDSSRVKFDMARKAPRARREIDYRSVVPAYVCSSDSTVVAVYLVSPEREERFPCR